MWEYTLCSVSKWRVVVGANCQTDGANRMPSLNIGYQMDHLEAKCLGFVIYLVFRMHQCKKILLHYSDCCLFKPQPIRSIDMFSLSEFNHSANYRPCLIASFPRTTCFSRKQAHLQPVTFYILTEVEVRLSTFHPELKIINIQRFSYH